MSDYRKQEPRNQAFFISDTNGAIESVNFMALENAGRDDEMYVAFLRKVMDGLRYLADDAEAEIIRKSRKTANPETPREGIDELR